MNPVTPGPAEIDAECSRQSAETLVPLCFVVTLMFIALAVAHSFLLPDSYRWTMTALAGFTALCFLILRLSWRGNAPPASRAHALSASAISLVALNSLTHIALSGEVKHSTNVALLIIGTGYLLFPLRWLAVCLFLEVLGWLGTVLVCTDREDVFHFGSMIVISLFISIIIYKARLISVRMALESRNGERRFRATFENNSSGNVVLSDSGRIVLANRSAERIFESRDTMVGKEISGFIKGFVGRSVREWVAATREMHDLDDEFTGVRAGGDEFPLKLTIERMAIGEEFIASIVDLSEVRTLQHRIDRSARLEAIGQLTGGIAHDFNNLLQVIVLSAELGRQHVTNGGVAAIALDDVTDACERAKGMISRLLTFSRAQPACLRNLDLNGTVEDILKLIRPVIGEEIDLQFEPAAVEVIARVDRSMLEQVLMNLCINARDAMPDGGKLSVAISEARDGDVAFARVEVSDSGCGMSDETMERIFEPFFTTKGLGNGSGLGLATVYGIVERHQGQVSVDSKPGWGTRFQVDFPIGSPTDPKVEITGNDANGEVVSGVVLLAEDNTVLGRYLGRSLETFGMEVRYAENGSEAVELFRKQTDVDILLFDVVMPLLNGPDAYRQIASVAPEIPVIFMTGYDEGRLTGVVDGKGKRFIKKPFDLATLMTMIRETMSLTDRQGDNAGQRQRI